MTHLLQVSRINPVILGATGYQTEHSGDTLSGAIGHLLRAAGTDAATVDFTGCVVSDDALNAAFTALGEQRVLHEGNRAQLHLVGLDDEQTRAALHALDTALSYDFDDDAYDATDRERMEGGTRLYRAIRDGVVVCGVHLQALSHPHPHLLLRAGLVTVSVRAEDAAALADAIHRDEPYAASGSGLHTDQALTWTPGTLTLRGGAPHITARHGLTYEPQEAAVPLTRADAFALREILVAALPYTRKDGLSSQLQQTLTCAPSGTLPAARAVRCSVTTDESHLEVTLGRAGTEATVTVRLDDEGRPHVHLKDGERDAAPRITGVLRLGQSA